MGAIDVGPDGSYQSYFGPSARTFIDITNPANASGTLTTMKIRVDGAKTVYCGTWYAAGGGTYTNRDYEVIACSNGLNNITGLNCTVQSGDYLGEYHGQASQYYIISSPGGGSGIYRSTTDGNKFGASGVAFASYLTNALCIYATGQTPGWSNIAKLSGAPAGDMSKCMAVAVADCAKISGAAL